MMINLTLTGCEKTGAIVCSTITVPEGGHVPLRLVNLTSEPIVLHKGTIMAVEEPVYQCSTLKEKVELEDKCECQCHCESFGAKPAKTVLELRCNSLVDKQIIIGKYH